MLLEPATPITRHLKPRTQTSLSSSSIFMRSSMRLIHDKNPNLLLNYCISWHIPTPLMYIYVQLQSSCWLLVHSFWAQTYCTDENIVYTIARYFWLGTSRYHLYVLSIQFCPNFGSKFLFLVWLSTPKVYNDQFLCVYISSIQQWRSLALNGQRVIELDGNNDVLFGWNWSSRIAFRSPLISAKWNFKSITMEICSVRTIE